MSSSLVLPVITLMLIINNLKCSTAYNNDQLAPALFVFGDSLLDVGNNNYLLFSNAKADFPHYGVDFPTHNPTGRFSNGKNTADFLADKLGLPSSPPYLFSMYSNIINYSAGVSFASGGAGIFDDADKRYKIYEFGGRKFVIFNVAAVGCCPSQRVKNLREECNEPANFWASIYNQRLQSLLQDYQTQYEDFQYSYFNTYAIFLDLIQQPAAYGFMEANAACCGMGKLNAEEGCKPESSYCSNRSDHVFWDSNHPSEAAARIMVETAFDGPQTYAFPVNVDRVYIVLRCYQTISTKSLS